VETVALDRYVVDTLMPDLVGHDKRPSALLVFLYLWARTDRVRGRRAAVSLRDLADGTGLSKRAVQDAVRVLARRRLVAVRRDGPTAVPEYEVLRPWRKR
jgi:hypothetical protein